MQQYSSTLLERAVGEFAKLPGIGRKTALRLVLHLLRQPVEDAEGFAEALLSLSKMSKAERDEMGAKGKEFAKRHFDFELQMNLLEDVFNGKNAE